MASLADAPDLVGFFSYSREDDEGSDGRLSKLRGRIHEELRFQLGRSWRDFRLWQDKATISHGELWEDIINKGISESVFFIPIITPTAVKSPDCKFEFDSFLARERELDRNDLIFPILYAPVPALRDERWRQDPLLSIIVSRQYEEWRNLRHLDVSSTEVAQRIEKFCANICRALEQERLSPEQRRDTEARQVPEAERRLPQEAEIKQRAEEEERLREAEAEKRRPGKDERHRQEEFQQAETQIDGEDLGRLTTAIKKAFNADELDQLVRITFSESLYQSYVGRDLTDEVLVFKLLEALERRGTTVIFLRAVRRARPHKQDLIDLIGKLCPQSMNDPPPATAPIGTVIAALQTLKDRVVEPDVAGSLRSSRDKFDEVAGGFERLKANITLYDCLQTIQIQLYTIDLSKARDDPSALLMLQNQVLQFDLITEHISKVAQSLPDTALGRRMEMKRLVDPLTQAVHQLRDAISGLDYPSAALALNTIRGLLRREPSRINVQLTAIAENLPIGQFIEAIEQVIRELDEEDPAVDMLRSALRGLHELFPRLKGQVLEHDIWQSIEQELSAADRDVDRGSLEAMQEFQFHWKAVKLKITPLWHANPQERWVTRSQKFSDAFEMIFQDVAEAPSRADQLRQRYNMFRLEALAQFYQVNNALDTLCGEIVEIVKPLNALLKEIPNAV
jgi:hypothetical protein